MSDLEQQLTGVLADVAEEAPHGVGLADGARRRHRVRRQRRLALGAAAAAVVVVAGAVVVGGLGGPDRASDPVDQRTPPVPGPRTGWQTIARDNVRAEVPADWVKVTCDEGSPARWSPPVTDPCARWQGAGLYGSATYDASTEAGVLLDGKDGEAGGYVYTADLVLAVDGIDRALALRILASARVNGQPVVDADQWVSFDRDGLTYQAPVWWGLGQAADLDPYAVCVLPPDSPKLDEESSGNRRFVLTEQPGPAGVVRVAAPTEAVALVVMATVDASEAVVSEECATEDFSTGLLPGESTPGAGEPVEGHERTLDLPTSNWKPGDPQLKARIAGVLQLAGDCVVLDGGPIVWPADYTATVDESGRVTVRDPGGAVVAHDGDRIDAGGGWSSAPETPDPCLPPGEVPYVQSEVTVLP